MDPHEILIWSRTNFSTIVRLLHKGTSMRWVSFHYEFFGEFGEFIGMKKVVMFSLDEII